MARDASDELRMALVARADRGVPRGGQATVDAAWTDGTEASLPQLSAVAAPRPSRSVRVVAAAAVIAFLLGAVVVRASLDEPTGLDTKPAAPQGATTSAPSSTATEPTSSTSAGKPQARISVSLYSGRRDPEWTPSAADQAELIAAIERLPRAATNDFPPTGLGYMGFLASGLQPLGRTGPVYILRYWVVVAGEGPGNWTVLDDPYSTVVRLVEDRAPAHFDDPNARAVIDSSIRSRSSGTTSTTRR